MLLALTMVSGPCWAQTAEPMQNLEPKRITLSCPTESIQDFERLADICVELGVTHVDISDLPKDHWQWFDPADPYPNWSMMAPSILKITVPKELRPGVPVTIAERSQKILAQRGEILRKRGLKAVFHGADPMWLPESVYEKHPDWRGPRCQSPIRSRHDYFAPCIDQPEVLALYRKATAQLCQLAPIESFGFLVNDSGSGACWHPGLYPGVNGPEFCKNRPMADRIQGFMQTLQDGAKDAGLNADVRFASGTLSGHPGLAARLNAGAGGGFYFWSSCAFPVTGVTDPVAFANALDRVFEKPEAHWSFGGIPSLESVEMFDLIREYRRAGGKGPLDCARALNAAAEHLAGAEAAPRVVRAWEGVNRALGFLRSLDNGGPVLLLGSINQRWLVRPLVPYPLELKPEEKDYFRKYQLQGQTEEDAANLMNCQGLFIISGDAGTRIASALFKEAIAQLSSAHKSLQLIKDPAPAVKALDLRVQTLILVIRNADITARYQAFLDRFRPEWSSRPDRCGYPVPEEGVKLVEEDLANTRELIALLKASPIPLLKTAPTAQEEDCFQFGPDLLNQLETKMEIEHRRMPEHQRLLHN